MGGPTDYRVISCN